MENLPNLAAIGVFEDNEPVLIILDDSADMALKDSTYINMMTKGSHHHNVSVLFTLQNYYHRSPDRSMIYLFNTLTSFNLFHFYIESHSCDSLDTRSSSKTSQTKQFSKMSAVKWVFILSSLNNALMYV